VEFLRAPLDVVPGEDARALELKLIAQWHGVMVVDQEHGLTGLQLVEGLEDNPVCFICGGYSVALTV
jgi:hypothetical protein